MSTTIVIDNGSHTIKGGFAGSFEPSCTFPTQVARRLFDGEHTQAFSGHEVATQLAKQRLYDLNNKNNDLEVSKPLIDHEKVDWDGLEKLWKYLMYDKLKLDKIRSGVASNTQGRQTQGGSSAYNDVNLLLSCHPTDSLKYKAKLMELGYETFDADGIFLCPTTTLGLYSVGKLTGTVVDSGYKNTFVSTIYEGYTMPFNVQEAKYGGATIDQFLQTIILQNPRHLAKLSESNNKSRGSKSTVNLNNLINLDECEMIKKKFCYCAQDFYEEESMFNNNPDSSFNASDYNLPDGSVISIRNEKYQACELLFQPKLGNMTGEDGIAEAVHQSISKCNYGLQKEMFKNIVVTGGNTMMPGFVHRLKHGVAHYAPAAMKVGIKAAPERNYSAFTGASILASQDQMKDVWITREMYDEIGEESLVVRCF